MFNTFPDIPSQLPVQSPWAYSWRLIVAIVIKAQCCSARSHNTLVIWLGISQPYPQRAPLPLPFQPLSPTGPTTYLFNIPGHSWWLIVAIIEEAQCRFADSTQHTGNNGCSPHSYIHGWGTISNDNHWGLQWNTAKCQIRREILAS